MGAGNLASLSLFYLVAFLFPQALAAAAHAATRREKVQVRASGLPDRASNGVRAEVAREPGSRRQPVHETLQMHGLPLRGQNEDPASTVSEEEREGRKKKVWFRFLRLPSRSVDLEF